MKNVELKMKILKTKTEDYKINRYELKVRQDYKIVNLRYVKIFTAQRMTSSDKIISNWKKQVK